MNITITPTLLSGSIRPPASKSQSHRLIIAAALSGGESTISHVNISEDITATLSCMAALGAQVQWQDSTTVKIIGAPLSTIPSPTMDCGESGSTLRFLIPVALAIAGGGTFVGHGRLMERPQTPYFEIFREKGIFWEMGENTLTVKGTLSAGCYALPGNVSSQFITGLLYALPLLDGDSEIQLTTPLESSGYVDMTLDALEHFGIQILPTDSGYHIPGNQKYLPTQGEVEADFSQSGFFYAMAGIGSPLKITGMNPHSVQGDRIVIPYMEQLNRPGEVCLDVRECPDLVPPLAARAALRAGEITRITNAGRLRLKESDRLAAVSSVINRLGGCVEEHADALIIHGKAFLPGGEAVDSWNDHRIAMMAAAVATGCEKPVTILGAQCVKKSYPTFWLDYAALGGILQEDAE